MAELSAHAPVARGRGAGGRSGKNARKGEAHQATAAGLDLLRVLGWLVLHDATLPDEPDTSVDHVLAGPSGVYVVNTVGWTGPIAVHGDVLTVDGQNRNAAVADVAAAADIVRRMLGATPVLPLLCFERLEAVTGVAGDVALCASENILDLLTSQPEILDTAGIARASRSLSAAFRPIARPIVRAVETTPETSSELPRPVSGPTLDELVRARAEQVTEQDTEPLTGHDATTSRAPSPEDVARVEAFEKLMGGGSAPAVVEETPTKKHRFGLRRGSRKATTPLEVVPDVPAEVLSEAPVEVEVDGELDAVEQPVEAVEVAPVRPSDATAVGDAGAALWLSLTDAAVEPDEATSDEVVDLEAAMAEAEARQRAAEEEDRIAAQRRGEEARALAEREAEEARQREEHEARERAEHEAEEARRRAADEARKRAAQAARERLEREALELAAREEQERLEAREQAERQEQERLEQEAREQAEREEQARLEAERVEAERLEQEAREQAEREELARLEAERLEAERLEQEAREQAEREELARLEAERLEQEAREQAEREEQARLEAERVEAERLEQERLEQEARERSEREEQARLEAERLEAERLEQERLEQEAREQAEREEQARLEAERLEAERLEQEAREQAEREEQEAREQAEREEQERLEQVERERAEEAAARAAWEARLHAGREARAREAAATADAGATGLMARHPDVGRTEVSVPSASESDSVAGATPDTAVAIVAPEQPAEPELVEQDLVHLEPAAPEPVEPAFTPLTLEHESELYDWEREVAAPAEPRIQRSRAEDAPEPVVAVEKRRRRRLGHGMSKHALVNVGIAALLIAGVIVGAPRVGGVVAWGQGLFAKEKPITVGTAVTLEATTYHPAAKALAGAPVPVQAQGAVGAVKGEHLVAVPIRIQNGGSAQWDVPVATEAKLVDALGVSHRVVRAVKAVKGYPLLPAVARIAPGAEVNGYVVFSVPNARDIRSVSLGLAKAGDEAVTWRVSP